jgi:hypothetical protein
MCLSICVSEIILSISANSVYGDLYMLLSRSGTDGSSSNYLIRLGTMIQSNTTATPLSRADYVCDFIPSPAVTTVTGLTNATFPDVMSCAFGSCAYLFSGVASMDGLAMTPAMYTGIFRTLKFAMGAMVTNHLNKQVCSAWSSTGPWNIFCVTEGAVPIASYSMTRRPSWFMLGLTAPGIPREAERPYFLSAVWDISGKFMRATLSEDTLRGAISLDTDGDFKFDSIDYSTQCPISQAASPPFTECPCSRLFDDSTMSTYLVANRLLFCTWRTNYIIEVGMAFPLLGAASETQGMLFFILVGYLHVSRTLQRFDLTT